MTRKIVLNDGTEIEDGTAGISSGGNLWIYFTGFTMMQAAMMFLDQEKTEKIVFIGGETEYTYEGYTNCVNLSLDETGRFHICMTREV